MLCEISYRSIEFLKYCHYCQYHANMLIFKVETMIEYNIGRLCLYSPKFVTVKIESS